MDWGQYLLVLDQDAQGCDYTIGCGVKYEYIALPADDLSLRDKMLKERLSEFGYTDNKVAKAFLIPLMQVEELPIELWDEKRKLFEQIASEAEIRNAELRQLEYLKRKYNNG